MRAVLVSKALVVGAYQRKAEEIARLGVDLTVLTPPAWRDRRGEQQAERIHTDGYELRTIPVRFNGNFHLHHYPTLFRELQDLRPDVVHLDEEPYNAATWLGVRAARRAGAATTFFAWQNIHRAYPPPFRWFERAVYAACPQAIAGNQDAADVLKRKGYTGEITLLPQFGVDPQLFSPAQCSAPGACLRIGYAGGLLPEKGLDLLLRACAGLVGEWRLQIAGGGEEERELRGIADEVGIGERVEWRQRIPSGQMPTFYQKLDVLVLPSRTMPNWKEQFGRVLIEAMSCGVAVVGSDSGEIPHVIGNGGLIFPEGDVAALMGRLQGLLDDRRATRRLGEAGRARVLAHFTMAQIAAETVAVYAKLYSSQNGKG
ncbi:MAG: glycosyltransferase family 4 protein [Caldilineaceae bacterium]